MLGNLLSGRLGIFCNGRDDRCISALSYHGRCSPSQLICRSIKECVGPKLCPFGTYSPAQNIHKACSLVQEKGGDLIQSRGAKWFPGALSNDSYPSSADSLTTIGVPGQIFYPAANPSLQGSIPHVAHSLHPTPGYPTEATYSDLAQNRHYFNGTHHHPEASTSGR